MDKPVKILLFYIFFMFISVIPLTADNNSLNFKYPEFKVLKADFIQEKKLAMFDDILIIRGTIRLENPDSLTFRTLSPVKQTIFIKGDNLILTDEDGKEQKFNIAKTPVMKEYLPMLNLVLQGKVNELEKNFKITVIKEQPLELICEPFKNSVSQILKKIVLSRDSASNYLKSVYMEEQGGDSLKLEFQNVEITPL